MAKYLVVHPKLSMVKNGEALYLSRGQEIDLDTEIGKRLIASGKVSLVVAKAEESTKLKLKK